MRLILVGGKSRAAIALRRFLSVARPSWEVVGVSREGDDARSICVARYEDIRASHLAGADAVVHCVGSPLGDVEHLDALNAKLALHVALQAREAGVRQFVHLSSLSIFGNAEHITAETRTAPTGGYGRSKAAAEDLLSPLANPDFALSVVRLPILYEGDSPNKLMQLARLMRRARIAPLVNGDVERSVLSYRNFAAVVSDILANRKSGVLFAADPGHFSMRAFAKMAPVYVMPLFIPDPVVRFIGKVYPQLHASLLQSSLIDESLLYTPSHYLLEPAKTGLQRLFQSQSQNLLEEDKK